HLSLGLEADLYAARLLSQTFSYPNPDGFQARPDAVADQQLGMNLYVTAGIHLVKMKKRCTCPRH
ncbi:MAG: hypothetical protein NW241_22255, partial [Bacteroidia bacterium]|nr:hypothetical protein [Bacteroidia bacterium]